MELNELYYEALADKDERTKQSRLDQEVSAEYARTEWLRLKKDVESFLVDADGKPVVENQRSTAQTVIEWAFANIADDIHQLEDFFEAYLSADIYKGLNWSLDKDTLKKTMLRNVSKAETCFSQQLCK